MSYQAITDIIVNTATLQNLQLSNTVKDSPNTTQGPSFSELVSYYKNEDTSEVREKSVDSDITSENISVGNEKIDSEKTEMSENDVKKTDVKEEKVESSKDDKSEVKASELDKKTAKNDELPELQEKSGKKEVVDKKLSKKDFARMEELLENEESLENTSKLAVNVQNNIKENIEIRNEEKSSNDAELIPVDEGHNIASTIQMTSNVETEISEYNFKENENSEKKQITLDKTGKITVEDLRTEKIEETSVEKKTDLKITEIKQTSENTAVMTMDLNQDVNADVLSLNNQTAASNGSNFQAMLNNQIQNSAPEFVKAGNLVLKDNNQGTINLILHPDDLGNVKIHLSLDGKTISGHITVATKEALQVFKDNAETLREAFIKNGFDAANFDVAFNNGGSFNQNMEFAQQNDGSDIFAKNVYKNSSMNLESELESIIENSEDISNYSVNIVA